MYVPFQQGPPSNFEMGGWGEEALVIQYLAVPVQSTNNNQAYSNGQVMICVVKQVQTGLKIICVWRLVVLTRQAGFNSDMSCFWPVNIIKKK